MLTSSWKHTCESHLSILLSNAERRTGNPDITGNGPFTFHFLDQGCSRVIYVGRNLNSADVYKIETTLGINDHLAQCLKGAFALKEKRG